MEINGSYVSLRADLSPRDESGWSWARHDRAYETPQAAYAALLESLHGSPVPASAPMWRIAFEPVEVTR